MTDRDPRPPGATPPGGRAYKEGDGRSRAQQDRARDAALVAEVVSGNRERFEELVNLYQRPLYSFVLRGLPDPEAGATRELAADLTQDAFLKAYRSLAGFDPKRSGFKTWLYTIAGNTVRDQARRRQVRAREMARLSREAAAARPEGEADRERVEAKLATARLLDPLDDESRRILEMKFLHDLAYQDIEEATGIPRATIRSKVHRALKKLHAFMTSKAPAGGEA